MVDESPVDIDFKQSSHGVDMHVPASIVSSKEAYHGAIFNVDERRIALTKNDGSITEINRQVIEHAPCVVMLVHDTVNDRYLIEREYRAGSNTYAYGLPAGLLNDGEQAEHAALRELREETGVVPQEDSAVHIEHVGDFYSSEGMTDELAHIVVLHLDAWKQEACEFDGDEYVESTWVDWQTLRSAPIVSSNSVIAILHEQIQRMK